MTAGNAKTDVRASELELEIQERRLTILRGISQDTPDLEIAKQLGVGRWMVVRDMRNMGYSGDQGFKDALKARDRIRAGKVAEGMRNRAHVRQERIFLSMTGMTLQERSFRNMVEYHLSELKRIMKDGDQSSAIRALPKETRRVLLNNGIVKAQKRAFRTWKLTESAREYVASLSARTSAAST